MNRSAALDPSEETLIDRLLAEQRSLTVVERFAQKHAHVDYHLHEKFYRELIPLSKPAPGQQYAFQVNLDTCTGCKACVSACHSLNGLEEHETWRDVGLIVGHENGAAYQQTVTSACHHCAEPGCLEGCPVAAYEKEADTGIVRHLDDQCIGCQYCTMKCPYEVPKYSERLGIVRKCDMCHDRLAVGEAPACVQACPHEAIQITLVDIATVRAESTPGSQMLPGAYDSSYTLPTTRYISERPIPASSHSPRSHKVHLEHAHAPLIVMLVLTQMAVGIYVIETLLGLLDFVSFQKSAPYLSAFAFLVLNAGLGAATLHLGRPLGAWRFFLGLRTSWMSREILAFSILAGAASLTAPLAWFFPATPWPLALVGVTALLGLGSVYTSAMIYIDTHRTFWAPLYSHVKFYGATLLLGLAATSALASWIGFFTSAPLSPLAPIAAGGTTILAALLLGLEFIQYRTARRDFDHPIHQTAQTIHRLLPWMFPARSALLAGLIVAALFTIGDVAHFPALWMTVILGLSLLSVALERYTFFAAVIPYRMPGGV